MTETPAARLEYYGVSPWEVEVAYGYLSGKFRVEQVEMEQTGEEDFVSYVGLSIPAQFGEQFFKWFEMRRWERLKGLFKEMKRRRGSGNAMKVSVLFEGRPSVKFAIEEHDKRDFNRAADKVDFVVELLPYHLAPGALPPGADELAYSFDPESSRWKPASARAGGENFVARGNAWMKL